MAGIDGKALRQQAARGGEEAREALERLWEHFYPRLLTYAATFRALPEAERDDAVSEVILKAFGRLADYNGQYSLSTWVYAIARNHFTDLVRRLKKAGSLSIEVLEEQNRPAEDTGRHFTEVVADAELMERCQAIIAGLKAKDRRLLFLKFYEGLNATEIGLSEGLPPGTVRRRLSDLARHIKEKAERGL
jgi:RNA polymerase sigma-70 factor (ECF subfamily)